MCQRDLRDRTVLQPTTAAAIDVSNCLLFCFILFLHAENLGYLKPCNLYSYPGCDVLFLMLVLGVDAADSCIFR